MKSLVTISWNYVRFVIAGTLIDSILPWHKILLCLTKSIFDYGEIYFRKEVLEVFDFELLLNFYHMIDVDDPEFREYAHVPISSTTVTGNGVGWVKFRPLQRN